jgi:NAD(P)-dependent dehydrogenase (short-subunit alcohol dehydrogenase family)
MSSFSGPKFALRALSSSLAREFAPQGVHVAHVIIDGAIDIPNSREMLKDLPEDAKLSPEEIAESYWNLHAQSRRGFTYELDIRSMLEKW